MAKEFFKNLPDTTTPLEASRLNGLLDGEEPMGNLVVDSIRTKNMWKPTILGIFLHHATASLEDDVYVFKATDTDVYLGEPGSTGSTYTFSNGTLYAVKPNTTYTISISNSLFKKNYVTQYGSDKVSLGYSNYTNNQITFTTSNNTYYISVRIGNGSATSGTTYRTTVQLEEGSTATSYTPYQNLNNERIIVNYANQITPIANISFNTNKQILQKNEDGLVIVNLTFTANANINMTNSIDLFTIPNDVKPSSNVILTISSTTQNLVNVAYVRTATNRVLGKLNATLNTNSEVSIVGSYYV